MEGLLIKKEKGQGVWANLPFFHLPPRRTEERGRRTPAGTRGKRERTPRGVDSSPQFQRRGPAGRGATAMAVTSRRRPWAVWQGRPEASTGRGKERGRARAPNLALGLSGEAAGRAGHWKQARRAKALAAAAMHGSGEG